MKQGQIVHSSEMMMLPELMPHLVGGQKCCRGGRKLNRYAIDIIRIIKTHSLLGKPPKKVILFVVGPLRGRGGVSKGRTTKKKNSFANSFRRNNSELILVIL